VCINWTNKEFEIINARCIHEENYLFFVMSTRCVFCKVRRDLYVYKYYLDTIWLQEVNTDAFYSALEQDNERDGWLSQCEGVTDFGTFFT
jgi:hypothetical protein